MKPNQVRDKESHSDYQGSVPVANSLVHELRGYRAVDTSTDGANNTAFWATYVANATDLLANELFLKAVINVPIQCQNLMSESVTMVQFGRQPHMFRINLPITSFPRGE